MHKGALVARTIDPIDYQPTGSPTMMTRPETAGRRSAAARTTRRNMVVWWEKTVPVVGCGCGGRRAWSVWAGCMGGGPSRGVSSRGRLKAESTQIVRRPRPPSADRFEASIDIRVCHSGRVDCPKWSCATCSAAAVHDDAEHGHRKRTKSADAVQRLFFEPNRFNRRPTDLSLLTLQDPVRG